MNKQELSKKMAAHEKKFDALWAEIVKDINSYVEQNGETNPNNVGRVDRFIDSLVLSGAWVSDRLNGFDGTPNFGSYKKSLTKKVRKALGYNL